jgi:hypothetical protein
MAFTFTCPQCQTKLRTAAAVPAGKTIQCPKCKTVFSAGAAEDEEAAAAPRRPAAQAPASPKRFADDDDDDRPRSRRRDDDDYDDEPRARRRSRAQDDYDDADGEREEDYGEPRKRKKKKKSGNKALFLTLMALLGLAVIGGGIFLVVSLLGRGGAVDKEMLAFAPADSKIVGGIDVEDILKQDKLKDPINKLMQTAQGNAMTAGMQQMGLSQNDFSKLLWAGTNTDALDKTDGVVVVKFKEPKPDLRDKLKTAAKASEVQKDGKTYYKAKDFCVYLPNDKMAVVTTKETGMAKVLAADGTTVAISGPVKDLVDKAGGAQVWFAMADDKFARDFGAGFAAAPRMGGMAGGPGQDMGDVAKGLKGLAFWGGVNGDKISVNFSAYTTSDAASKAASSLSSQLREMRPHSDDMGKMMVFMGNDIATLFKEVVDSGDVSSSGEQLIFSCKVSVDPIVNLINKGGAGLPFPGMGGFGGPGPNLGAGNAPGAPKRGAKNANPFGPGKAPPPKPPAGGPQVVPAPGPGGGIVLP